METKELTILKAIENIHTQSKGSLLLLERYESVNYEIDLVSNYFKINKIESILLAINFCENEKWDNKTNSTKIGY